MRTAPAILLGCLLGFAGCRAVVEPGAVGAIGDVRIVEGRIEGLEGAPFDHATLNLSSGSGGDPFSPQSVAMDSTGRFVVEVDRGTVPEVFVEAVWDGGSPLQRWVFAPVVIRDEIVLEHRVQPFSGQVVVAGGLSADLMDALEIELFELRSLGYDTVSLTIRGEVALDGDGRFETWLPERRWRVEVDLRSLPGIVSGGVEWWWLDTEAGLDLSIPLERGRLDLTALSGLPEGTQFHWEAYFGVVGEDDLLTSADLRSIVTLDGGFAETWIPTAAFHVESDYRLSRTDGESSLGGFGWLEVESGEDPAPDAGRILRVDAGDHLLRVAVQRNGVPQPWLGVELVGVAGRTYAQTDSAGVAWLAADAGPKRVGIDIEGPADQWYDVIVPDQLDITIDLDDADLTPPAPPPAATKPSRRP